MALVDVDHRQQSLAARRVDAGNALVGDADDDDAKFRIRRRVGQNSRRGNNRVPTAVVAAIAAPCSNLRRVNLWLMTTLSRE